MLYGCTHQCLAYADNLVLMVRSRKELQHIFKLLEEKAKKIWSSNEWGKDMLIKCSENRMYKIEKVEQIDYLKVTYNYWSRWIFTDSYKTR